MHISIDRFTDDCLLPFIKLDKFLIINNTFYSDNNVKFEPTFCSKLLNSCILSYAIDPFLSIQPYIVTFIIKYSTF